MWRQLARELGYQTFEPATEDALRTVEVELGCSLPRSLRGLLAETDGLTGDYGLEVVMTASRLLSENRTMRSTPDFAGLYMPFDHLLFFGAAGNGDLFAFPVHGRVGNDRDVFIWDHEDDSRATASASLERYVRGENWYSGSR